MIKVKAKTIIDGQTAYDKEGESYAALFEADDAIRSAIYRRVWWNNGVKVPPIVEGQKGKMTITIEWECTLNRRAKPRPKNVIAAENAARAVKRQQKQAQTAKWEEERLRRLENLRIRIQNQINHVFAVGAGKTGSDPVGKYITCQHCDAPAALLTLKAPMPKGAHMLDEDLINGALCAVHSGANTHGWGRNAVTYETIPCARLEFLYDGIRAIALKP